MMPTTTTPNTIPTPVDISRGEQDESAESKLTSSASSTTSPEQGLEGANEAQPPAKKSFHSSPSSEKEDDGNCQKDGEKLLSGTLALRIDETPPRSTAGGSIGSNYSEWSQNSKTGNDGYLSLDENDALQMEGAEDGRKSNGSTLLLSGVPSDRATDATCARDDESEETFGPFHGSTVDATNVSSPKRFREHSDDDVDDKKEELQGDCSLEFREGVTSTSTGAERATVGNDEVDGSYNPKTSEGTVSPDVEMLVQKQEEEEDDDDNESGEKNHNESGGTAATDTSIVAPKHEGDGDGDADESEGESSMVAADISNREDHDTEHVKIPAVSLKGTGDDGDEEAQNDVYASGYDDEHSYEYVETDSAEERPMEADLLSERCVIDADMVRLEPVADFDLHGSLGGELGWSQGDHETVSSSDIGLRHGVIARNSLTGDAHSDEGQIREPAPAGLERDDRVASEQHANNSEMVRGSDDQDIDAARRPSDLDNDDDEDSPTLQVFLIYDPEDKGLQAGSEVSELSSVAGNDNNSNTNNNSSRSSENRPAGGFRGNKRSRRWIPGKKSRRRIDTTPIQGSKIPLPERTGDPTRLAPQQRLFRCLRARRQRSQRREMSMTTVRLLQLFMAIPFLFAPTLYLILDRPKNTAPSPASPPSGAFATFSPTFQPSVDVDSDSRFEIIPPEVSDGSGLLGMANEDTNAMGGKDEDLLPLLKTIVEDGASSDPSLRSLQDIVADLDNPGSAQYRAVHGMAAFDDIASDLVELIRLESTDAQPGAPARRALLERYALFVLSMETTEGIPVPGTDFPNPLKGVCEWNNQASTNPTARQEVIGVGCADSGNVGGTRRRLDAINVPTSYLRRARRQQEDKISTRLLPDLRLVRSLTLRSSGLSGSLPPDIGLLDGALTRMELQGNALRGEIPLTIGSLDHLVHLDLSDNAFDGAIPWSLFWKSPSQLREVNLKSNQLTSIQFPDATASSSGSYFQIALPPTSDVNLVPSNIRVLHLENNKLSGNITFLCDLLPQLETLTADCDLVICSCCDGCA